MSHDSNSTTSRRTILKTSAAGAGIVAAGVITNSAAIAALDTGDLDGKTIDFGSETVELGDLDVLVDSSGTGDEHVAVEGKGEYAIVVFADDVVVEHGDVTVTIAETELSDSRAFYLEGSVDTDSDVDAKRYVEFVVDGVEMIATDVLGTDVDVFLNADEEDA